MCRAMSLYISYFWKYLNNIYMYVWHWHTMTLCMTRYDLQCHYVWQLMIYHDTHTRSPWVPWYSVKVTNCYTNLGINVRSTSAQRYGKSLVEKGHGFSWAPGRQNLPWSLHPCGSHQRRRSGLTGGPARSDWAGMAGAPSGGSPRISELIRKADLYWKEAF